MSKVKPLDEVWKQVIQQREEILRAFIAKYRCEPEDVVQCERTDYEGIKHWWVQKREDK